MSLLDLPPELFLHITQDIIDTCGIPGSWKLREVCRTFADNITHEIMNRPTTAFVNYRDRRFFDKSVHRYLAARLHNELDVDPILIQKVRDMVAWGVSESGATTLQQRDDVAFKVCAALKHSIGSWELVHALECDENECYLQWPAWSREPIDSHDKMTVIAAVGCYDNASEVLQDLSNSSSKPSVSLARSWLCFVPFKFAFQTGDEALLNSSLQYLAGLTSQGAEGKKKLIELTSESGQHFNMSNAVLWAIGCSSIDGLRRLLDFYRKYLAPPKGNDYKSWVRKTLSSTDNAKAMQLLSAILAYKPRGKSMVDKHVITTACDYGTAAMIQEVLKHANKDIDTGTILTLPVFIAVRSGRTAAIRGVVDAGADPKVVADSNMRSVEKKRLTPLEYAMHRNSPNMVEALLQRGGGPIPHISEWTLHRRTYNFLRSKVFEDSQILLPRLREFKWLTSEQRKAIVH